jgi:hypothetical protein
MSLLRYRESQRRFNSRNFSLVIRVFDALATPPSDINTHSRFGRSDEKVKDIRFFIVCPTNRIGFV